LSDRIKELAAKENRSATGQAQQLIEEALAYREKESQQNSLEIISRLIHRLSAMDIAQLIQMLGYTLRMKLQKEVNLCNTLPNNRIAQLVREHHDTCLPFFQGWEGGEEMLRSISEGGKPDPRTIPLLVSCLPISQVEFESLYIQEFGFHDESTAACQGCDG
jgi:hypothetical protein